MADSMPTVSSSGQVLIDVAKEVKFAKKAAAYGKGREQLVPRALGLVYLGSVLPMLFMQTSASSLVFTVKRCMKSGHHHACYMISLWLPSSSNKKGLSLLPYARMISTYLIFVTAERTDDLL